MKNEKMMMENFEKVIKEAPSVRKLLELKNSILAEVARREQKLIGENTPQLIKEILDLHEGVGNFREGDYYAPSRVYSEIPGVKNLRGLEKKGDNWIVTVKVTSPRGYLLPDVVEVPSLGRVELFFMKSSKFEEGVDY